MNISFGNNTLQDLINKPQAFAAPATQTAPAKPDVAGKDCVELSKKTQKKTLIKGLAIGAAAMAVALPLIAGRGNIAKGFKVVFQGVNKFVDEATKPVREAAIALAEKADEAVTAARTTIADLTEKLTKAPGEALESVISKPKDHEGFLVKLMDMIKGSKYGDLTDPIEQSVTAAAKPLAEATRTVLGLI